MVLLHCHPVYTVDVSYDSYYGTALTALMLVVAGIYWRAGRGGVKTEGREGHRPLTRYMLSDHTGTHNWSTVQGIYHRGSHYKV